MYDFAAEIDAVIGEEGRYSNDPLDHGGETMWGITIKDARANGYTGAMIDLPRSDAVAIYRKQYVIAPQFDLLDTIDRPLAARLFDAGVNLGPEIAGLFVQRALNALAWNVSSAPLKLDGEIGPVTRKAIADFYARRGDDGRHVLLGMVAAQQSVRYLEIAEGDHTQEQFEFGWQLHRAIGDAVA